MPREPTDFAFRLSGYFLDYLAGSRDLSEHTIASRRTTFSLLIDYCAAVEGIPTSSLSIQQIDRPLVERFLSWTENVRGNSASTRNVRMDAIKSFFSYLQTVAPEHLLQCQQIAAMPRKRAPKACVRWLTLEEVQSLLAGIDGSRYQGLRNLALLSLLYDSAARVSELAGARVRDLRTGEPARVRLFGKGPKERFVPLMSPTVDVLAKYLERRSERSGHSPDDYLFVNRSGGGLTRGGVTYVLQKCWSEAGMHERSGQVTPHVLRHSRAVHLLQAGVPIVYIRDFLGHEGIATTEVYARCDQSAIRRAIEKSNNIKVDLEEPIWEREPGILRWLESLSE